MALYDDILISLQKMLGQVEQLNTAQKNALAVKDAEIHRLKTEIAQMTPANKPSVPKSHKTLWGSSIETRGQTWPLALKRVENAMGPIDVVRIFQPPGKGFVVPAQLIHILPRSIVYSVKYDPAEVISGAVDRSFISMMNGILPHLSANPQLRFYYCLEHEGDIDIRKGRYTARDYRDAWGRLINLAKDSHPNFLSCNIFTKYALEPSAKFDARMAIHPAIDVVAWDTYKWSPTTTVSSMIDPILEFSSKFMYPWAIAETGVSSKDFEGGKAHTAQQKTVAAKQLAEYIRMQKNPPEFVCYFNSDPGEAAGWPLDTPGNITAAQAWEVGKGN